MGNEGGEWILYGVDRNDPRRLASPEALLDHIDDTGFLPLFKNDVPGFSVEERTCPQDWWTGDPARDPWEWRELLARSGRVAYGKFFDKKAGFISLKWLPAFANCRRDGYDFDALWEDGKAHYREKKVMDQFARGEEHPSYRLKALAGFGKGGEKNFEGTLAGLQMRTYLVMRRFRRRQNRAGEPYGWSVAVYAAPESVWGYDQVTSAYGESPETSQRRIVEHLHALYPDTGVNELEKLLR